MNKNRKHIDAKEFFKLLSQETGDAVDGLDEFDQEALEGLKLVKNPAAAHERVNAAIDQKLEELITSEKKHKPKTGLYILSFAASLVLLFGLFFVFKQDDAKDVAVAESTNTELSPSGETFKAPVEEQLDQVNSDASVTQTRKEYTPLGKENLPLSNTEKDQMLKDRKEAEEAGINNLKQVTKQNNDEAENVIAFETYNKTEDQKDYETVDSKIVTATNTGGINVPKEKMQEGFVLDEKAKRSVNKKKEEKVPAKKAVTAVDDYPAATAPVQEQAVPEDKNKADLASTNTVSANSATLNQSGATSVPGSKIYKDIVQKGNNESVDVQADFNGGKNALDKYIADNLKIPDTCPAEEVIVIKFLIDKDGKIAKPKIQSKTGNCPDCEKEAIRFVKAMPAWTPATKAGLPVSSHRTLVLSFKK